MACTISIRAMLCYHTQQSATKTKKSKFCVKEQNEAKTIIYVYHTHFGKGLHDWLNTEEENHIC